MVRVVLACLTFALSGVHMHGADPALTARVALALGDRPESCGRCVGDLEACRAKAVAEGKTLAIFVGGCHGLAQSLPADVIACRVRSYDRDGEPATKPRVVIVRDSKIRDTLPGDVPPVALKVAIKGGVKWKS